MRRAVSNKRLELDLSTRQNHKPQFLSIIIRGNILYVDLITFLKEEQISR